MNKHKKRAQKYTSTLRRNNRTVIEPHSMYRTDKDKAFYSLDALKVKYEGITIETYLNLYHDLQEDHKELNEYLRVSNDTLTAFLIEKGYNTPNIKQMALIKDLSRLLVIQDSKPYQLVKVNDEKYIVNVLELDGIIIDKQDKPTDYDKGWYQFINGEYVIDEDKKNKILGALL